MAQTIKLKRSSVSGNTPGTSDLELGEVAINTYDGKMFIKKNDGSDSIVEIGGTSGTVTEAFKTIAVSGQSSVVADSATDTLTLVAGSNMTLTTNASGDTITFASSGGGGTQNVFSTFAVSGQSNVVADSTTDTLTLVAGTGIGITTDASADSITIANTTNLFSTIAVSGQSNVVADATSDTLTFVAGSGITLTTDASADSVTITNSATGANAFGNILVSGQSTVAADSTNDNLTLVAGSNMTITTNASNDTITFASSGGGSSQNLFSNIAVSGQGTIQADATTDTLTFEAGSGITLTTDTTNDKLTITSTGSSGNAANAASSIKEFKYDISSSTTTITGSDANSNTLAYEAGAIQVFLNGILLDPATDYTASNGTSVVLTDAAVNGDDVQIVSFNRKIVSANVGIDTFTGNGSTTAYTLSSDPVNENNTRVHIDGVYQEKAAYSVSGTTLTFSAAPPNNSSIEVEVGFTQAEIGSTLDFADNAILRIGTGNDLQILHDGTKSSITDSGTGWLEVNTNNFRLQNAAANETLLYATENGSVQLYHNNSKKLETVTSGVTITGTVTATTFSGDLSGTINTATTGTTQSASDNSTKLATTAYVTTALSNLVDSAPGTLNTLNELAAALGDDANFSTTITNSLATKVGLTATTGAATIPAGTTAQRPGSPAAGQFRYNSTLSQFEGYTNAWGAIGGGGTNTFTTDVFTASGSAAFTLTQAVSSPNDCIVHVDGIYQTPTDAYTVSGTTLTFTATPANGRKIVVYSVKAGVSGNNLNTQTFSGNGSATSFTMNVNPINENNTIVHIDGVYQQKTSYSTSGTTISFSAAPANGTTIEVATFTQTEINVPVNDTIDTVHIKDDAVTSAKLGGNLTTPGTLTSTGLLTADAGVAIDNITIDGTEIDLSSGDLTIDVAGDIILDADGGDINFKDGGTTLLSLSNAGSNNVQLSTQISDGDLLIKGIDNTTPFTALTFDMSEAGAATFNAGVTATTFTGTLSTAAQTNITSVGTLTGLTVAGALAVSPSNGTAKVTFTSQGVGSEVFSVNGQRPGVSNTGFAIRNETDSRNDFMLDGAGNATFAGTIATGGITINGAGSTISDSSDLGIVSGGTLTVDVTGDITLDAGGSDIRLYGGGAEYGKFNLSGNNLNIHSSINNADIVFKGEQSSSTITALTLDMSESGRATFNEDVVASGLYVGARNASYDFYNNGTGYNNGAFTVDDTLTITGRVTPNEHIVFGSSTGYLQFPGASSRAWAMASQGGTAAPGTNSATFGFHHWSGSSWSNPVNITASGKLGIGTSNPNAQIEITKAANTYDSGILINNSSSTNPTTEASALYHDNSGYTATILENRYNSTLAKIIFKLRTSSSPVNALTLFGTGDATVSGNLAATEVRPTSHLVMNTSDSQKIYMGAGNDLEIYHDGNDNIINAGNNHSLRIRFAGVNQWEFHNGSYFKGNDGKKIILGNSSDLQIYHDGNHSYIHEQGTGALKLKTDEIRLEDSSGYNRYKIASNNRQFFFGMNGASSFSVGSWSFGHTADANGYMSSWTSVFGQRIHLRTNGSANPSQTGTVSFAGSGSNNFRIMQNMGYNGVYWNAGTQSGRATSTEMDNGVWYWSNTDSIASGSQYTVTNRMRLDVNGNLAITGTYANSQNLSDERLKQDIEDLPSALENVKALRAVTFNWIDEERRRDTKELGLIAQEALEIYPEMVDSTDFVGSKENEETLEKEGGEERYFMHYEKLSVVLLKAMQEQQELIETLQAKVAALEAK